MDDKQKKQINDVICTVKNICDEHFSECMGCPLYKRICNGLGGWQRQPYLWQMLQWRCQMDEEKKKKLNDAITVLRDMCEGHGCSNCPMFKLNCNGSSDFCDFPINWVDID